MKKIVLTFISSVLMAASVAVFGFAQASLNSPGSMPTLTVANVSTNPCTMGPIDGCWKNSASARPGEQIAVHIYYKNTGNQVSEGTTLSIKPKDAGVSSSVTFTGGVASLSAPRSVGSATVTFSTPSKITYIPGSAKWYPNSSSSGQSVSESGLFGTSGFNIGTISPGTQGVLVANFIVEAGQTNPNPQRDCRINDFNVDGRSSITIRKGDTARLSWNTTDCDSASIDNIGSVSLNSNTIVSPNNTTTYTLRANPNGGTRSVTVYVDNTNNPNPQRDCRINDFNVDGRSSITIRKGDTARLSWNTTDCEYVMVTDFSGNLNPNSSGVVKPSSDRTYILTAYPGGYTQTVRIYVENYNSDPNRDSCDIISFRTNRSTIDRGQVATISWEVRDADTVDILPGYRNRSNKGSITVSPNSTTTYRIEVSGNRCSNSDSVTINVRNSDSSKPQAITTVAAITGPTSAQLNGIAVPNTYNYSSSVWFEWGTTTSLVNRTAERYIPAGSSNITHGDGITGLRANTTYYYRTVVENQNGIAYGDIVSFRTPSAPTGGTTVVTPPTQVIVQTIRDNVSSQSAPSLLELQVASAYEHMCIGGDMEYVVTYKNISSVTLEDAVLRLALPKELNFIGANRGSYDSFDRVLTIPVGRLSAGEQGTVTLRTQFNNNAIRGNLAVMTSTMVYTNPITRAQEDAIAYSLVTVSDECPMVLGASVGGFGSFLPTSLLEWLLLILVILILVILARNIYKKREEEKAEQELKAN